MATKTFEQFGVLGLYTETPLHCGTESTVGYVDLPIQRERHTQYPVIQGSSIKGVMRDESKRHEKLKGQIDRLFGCSEESAQHADKQAKKPEDDAGDTTEQSNLPPGIPGSVSFGDGILVAFPVRSSLAPFHWVTCPFVLERVLRLLGECWRGGHPPPGEAWASQDQEAYPVLLEELLVTVQHNTEVGDAGSGVISHLLDLLPNGDRGFAYTRERFAKRLLVIDDDSFRELVTTATDIVTRIKLNILGTTRPIKEEAEKAALKQELGMAEDEEFDPADLQGNLFVEELVPPETLFACALRAPSRPNTLAEAFESLPVIRLGGDETIGRGVTHLTYRDAVRSTPGTAEPQTAEEPSHA